MMSLLYTGPDGAFEDERSGHVWMNGGPAIEVDPAVAERVMESLNHRWEIQPQPELQPEPARERESAPDPEPEPEPEPEPDVSEPVQPRVGAQRRR